MKRVLFSILAMGIIAVTYPIAMRYSQSFKFVDEDEHLVIGWLLTQGEKLYTDISTNHQPLNYLASAAVHTISHPANIFMLIQRHRQAVFIWGMVWAGILVWRFGLLYLVPLLLYEVIKYWLLGNEFLAESFAVYPTLYIFGSSWQLWINKHVQHEDLLLGMSFMIACLFSIPLAIPLGILVLSRWLHEHTINHIIETCGGMGIILLGVFSIVPFKQYLLETIVYNGKYGIPLLSEFRRWYDIVGLWILPYRSFTSLQDPLSQLYAGIGAVWLVVIGHHLCTKQWRKLLITSCFYFVWGLTNLRVFQLHQYYYSGFHLLPWVLTGFGLTTLLIHDALSFFSRTTNRLLTIGALFLLGIWLLNPTLPFRQLPNPQTDNYIQYTPQLQVAEVIAPLQLPEDRLMTIPNETLPYWITKLKPATRQVTYYEWQYRNPSLRSELEQTFATHPPRFITYLNEGATFTPYIQQQLQQSYVKIFDFPLVYVRKDSLPQISSVQQQQFLDLAKTHTGINTHVFETK